VLTAIGLVGCNTPYGPAPSTAAAQKSVNAARGNVDSAMADNRAASDLNRSTRTKAELIDNKASVVEKYWK
jgi:hypothetical protein